MIQSCKSNTGFAKHISFLLILLIFNCPLVGAQSNTPPVYEIKADTASELDLDNVYWQILNDQQGKWTIEQVSKSPLTDKFHTNTDKNNQFDYSIHFYWLRYRLKNSMNKEVRICLTNNTNADQCDFYLYSEVNKLAHYTTGVLYPKNKADGFKRINYIPVLVQPGEEIIIYNRLKNLYFINKPKRFSVSLGFTEKVIKENYTNNEANFTVRDFTGIFTGILLFGCLFSLFFYFIVKNRVYLYYALFLFYFSFSRDLLSDFIFPDHPLILYVIDALIKSLGIFLFVQFIRYFLKTFDYFPVWDKALKCIAILHPIGFLTRFLFEPYLTGRWDGLLQTISDLLFDIGLFMILITFLKFIRYSDRLATVLKISAIPASVFWSFGFTLVTVFDFLNIRMGVPPPPFIIWLYSWFDILNMICVIWLALSFSWVLLLQFVQLRKENAQQALDRERLAKEKEMERNQLIELQKIELQQTVDERTSELKRSLWELQSTQSLLIQSEKMASLGELTAGIAHEIQNPLNFVNNFSEVNRELIEEMRQEMATGNIADAIEIANDVQQNEEKINYHGKRADTIIKGMLQHSRTSSGVKELTDINALADEYLRLAYRGLRGKDSSFKATMKTDFDDTIEKINVVPQDIGRVLLNLYNNAFYAVNEKKKSADEGYEPTVSVNTKKTDNKITITVTDNGNGIPRKIVDKIFQPFFTTKPTGQGTGLGLSLSYDIVKSHAGELKVNTHEGEYAEFILTVPIVT